MPYEPSAEKISALVERAFADPKLAKDIKQARLTTGDLLAELSTQPQIWDQVRSEIDRHRSIEDSIRVQEEQISVSTGPPPKEPSYYSTEPPGWLVGPAVLLFLGSLVWLINTIRVSGFWAVVNSLRELRGWLWPGVAMVVFIAFGLLVSFLEQRRKRMNAELLTNWEAAQAVWNKKRTDLEEQTRLASLKLELGKAETEIGDKLIEKSIGKKLFELINSRTEPSYDSHLAITEARGLAEVFDPQFAIDTTAKSDLFYMLENTPGGSIGVAGPRGAGKTTLLRLCCGPKSTLKEINGREVLAVMVSAPVVYQARDFILYLFSSVCQAVLEKEDPSYERTRPDLTLPVQSSQDLLKPALSVLKPAPRLMLYIGALLVVFSMMFAAVSTVLTLQKGPEKPAANNTAPPATPPAIGTEQKTQSSTQAAQKPDSATMVFFKSFDVKPGAILLWGIFLIGASFVLAGLLGTTSRRLLRGVVSELFPTERSRQKEWERAQLAAEEVDRQKRSKKDLKTRAADWLKDIKFQQTYTSGWSGSLKLPVGLEGGLSNAVTLAENQLSMPEITHELKDYLGEATKKYQVIIGIDELDKLESDKAARRFINDIKAIFGIDKVFYLVSVSQDAMSSFERRGLPIRDEFDSSFDRIISVSYLNFDSARELLEQRVIGRPMPFFALSYCMSGGLARDLIRSFRSVFEFRKNHEENDLESIAGFIICRDLEGKIRGTALSAKKIALDSEVDTFLEHLYAIEVDSADEQKFAEAATTLLNMAQSLLVTAKQATDDAKKSKLEALSGEYDQLAAYIYYAMTLLQFFKNTVTKDSLTSQAKHSHLDDLAKARQALADNPSITRTIVGAFRKVHNLPDPIRPAPSVAAATAGSTP